MHSNQVERYIKHILGTSPIVSFHLSFSHYFMGVYRGRAVVAGVCYDQPDLHHHRHERGDPLSGLPRSRVSRSVGVDVTTS